MKNNTTEKSKYQEENEKRHLAEVSRQVEMALESKDTPEAVKDCLKSIIIEASIEANLTLGDMSLVRQALPNIIENLNQDYGRGILHSIHSIIRFDTDAYQKFYDERLDENAPESEEKQRENQIKKRQDLFASLDDYGTAAKYRLKKTEAAKELIAQILVVTNGACELPENKEWAHENLLELFEMFVIRHDNYSRSTLAEDLQSYLFTWTHTHDDCYSQWRKSVFAERGLDDDGEPLDAEVAR